MVQLANPVWNSALIRIRLESKIMSMMKNKKILPGAWECRNREPNRASIWAVSLAVKLI